MTNNQEYKQPPVSEAVSDNRQAGDASAVGLPVRMNRFLYWLGGFGLKLLGGWKIEGSLPNVPKGIIPIAPHTSNWDFFVGLFVKFRLGLEVNFLGKHSLFRFPIKGFLNRIGGIPIRRGCGQGAVSSMCDAFAQREQLILVIAPEGTRKKVKEWKTGFLQIAKQAQVPVIPVALDYASKVVRIGPAMDVVSDIQTELVRVQQFTGQAQGKIARNG